MTDAISKPPTPAPGAFRFGRNWQRYVENYLDSDRVQIAAQSLDELVGDLQGRTFLDVGCGSGLFSLCAFRAGARRVVSFDVDPDSVETTKALHREEGAPGNWQVLHGSILDPEFVERLEPAEVVYSWGVLHHTGDMYAAIENTAYRVAPGGLLVIAIYNRIIGKRFDSQRWLQIKRTYNTSPRGIQRAMELAYGLYWLAGRVRSRQNPVRVAREYRRSRGMALWTDLVDWLGGYPYEFATPQEILDFCERGYGLRCSKLLAIDKHGSGNNQFVFERPTPQA